LEFADHFRRPRFLTGTGWGHASVGNSGQNVLRLPLNISIRPQIKPAASLLHVILVHGGKHRFNVSLETEGHNHLLVIQSADDFGSGWTALQEKTDLKSAVGFCIRSLFGNFGPD